MFFIGVFGMETKNKEIKRLSPMMCKHCRETVAFHLFKHYHQFHFFFIPLLKWKMNYYIVCESCQCIATIPIEKGKALQMGEAVELTLWDQDIIEEPSQIKKRCSNCQEVVDSTYQYCPHCGNHL